MPDNPFVPKPIEEVLNELHTIKRILNELKINIVCIDSDIKIIKDKMKEQEKAKEEISKGWLF